MRVLVNDIFPAVDWCTDATAKQQYANGFGSLHSFYKLLTFYVCGSIHSGCLNPDGCNGLFVKPACVSWYVGLNHWILFPLFLYLWVLFLLVVKCKKSTNVVNLQPPHDMSHFFCLVFHLHHDSINDQEKNVNSDVHSLALGQHPSQARLSQIPWPGVGFGLASDSRSQSQASKLWLWVIQGGVYSATISSFVRSFPAELTDWMRTCMKSLHLTIKLD